jgi:regulator of protease activity HflC (stomatin/prohibitin superfamily)
MSNSTFSDLLCAANGFVWFVVLAYVGIKFLGTVQVVPTQTVRLVERLGRFHRKLGAGMHVLLPWLDRVTYIHDLREQTVDVPPQQCFTRDNVRVIVDGVMYIQVIDALKASYGVTDYRRAAMQLALTTSRAIIATLDLDKTFEERDMISAKVVQELAQAGMAWGIQVLRYEIKNIEPPDTVKSAMEAQVTAERNRRAVIARSEGEKQARINRSEGVKNELTARSSGEKQRLINEAQGRAREILALAEATAVSIERLAVAISSEGGERAVRLRLSEAYIDKLSGLARGGTRVLLPADLTKLQDLLRAVESEEPEPPTHELAAPGWPSRNTLRPGQ